MTKGEAKIINFLLNYWTGYNKEDVTFQGMGNFDHNLSNDECLESHNISLKENTLTKIK